MLIDLHCHLDLFQSPLAVIERVRHEGIFVLAVTTTPLACDGLRALVSDASRIRVAAGLHPVLAAQREGELEVLIQQIDRTRYVGEVGLDGTAEHREHLDAQERVFSAVLEQCDLAGGRVMTIHSRGAAGRVLDLLQRRPGAGVPVLHWFSGTERELARAVEMGCWFSVGPAMLRSAKGARIAALIPLERVLTETDGPFAQGRRLPLMPWDVRIANDQLAEAWHVSSTDAPEIVTQNFRNLVAGSQPLSCRLSTALGACEVNTRPKTRKAQIPVDGGCDFEKKRRAPERMCPLGQRARASATDLRLNPIDDLLFGPRHSIQ